MIKDYLNTYWKCKTSNLCGFKPNNVYKIVSIRLCSNEILNAIKFESAQGEEMTLYLKNPTELKQFFVKSGVKPENWKKNETSKDKAMKLDKLDYVYCINDIGTFFEKGENYLVQDINSDGPKNDAAGIHLYSFMNRDGAVYTLRFRDSALGGYFLKMGSTYDLSDIKPKEDKVNHPSHYTWLKEKCGIEVIDITRHMGFDLGNAIKYILRCGHKSEQGYSDKEKTIEDLQKAVWYINDEINQLKDGLDSK